MLCFTVKRIAHHAWVQPRIFRVVGLDHFMLDLVGHFTLFDQVNAIDRLVMLSIEDGAFRLVTFF